MAASHSAARSYMMDNLRDQTARMRKTFRYPADEETESVDSQPEAMDEEGTSLDALGGLPHGGAEPSC